MPHLLALVLGFLLGFAAGLRSMTPLAVVSWAAHLGALPLDGTVFAFFASPWSVGVFTLLAVGELIGDKLPIIPSRKKPAAFIARIASGAIAGAALGAAVDGTRPAPAIVAGLFGALGAVAGTLGGYEFRSKLAKKLDRDLPAALIEDAIAIVIATLAVALA